MLEIIEHGELCELRLARPPVNALNLEFVEQLAAAVNGCDADALILSGSPGMFCAGLDVVQLQALERSHMQEFWQAFFGLLEAIACSTAPVAAAITGHAPAGGTLISVMADYRVMSEGAYKIGLNETRIGLLLPPLLHDAMTWLVGPRTAESLVVSGALLTPGQALESGLVDALEDDFEATVQHALGWCRSLLTLPRQAMLGNRATARARYRKAFNEGREDGVAIMTGSWFADEARAEIRTLVAQLKSRG